MNEHKFLVARNDWIVRQIMKKIYKGRLTDYDKVLLADRQSACKAIKRMPFGRQELYSIFRVTFDKDRIVRS